MKRRDFLQLTGMGIGGAMLTVPLLGKAVDVDRLLEMPIDVAEKKRLANIGLNTAKSNGASYADVRIGRYLNQYIFTREDKLQNAVNTESFGVGVRVLADGTWGFASTKDVSDKGIQKATEIAVSIAKANAKIQTEPVQLAPVQSFGDVSWKTPLERNAVAVPLKEKVDLLLSANAEAINNGANFVNSALFLINEQKYFASTEGSYIDQDVHRIWPNFNVTAIDSASGKYKSRQALSSPMGMGFEYMDARPQDKKEGPGGTMHYFDRYDMIEDAGFAGKQATEMLKADSIDAGKYDLVLDPNHLGLTIHESVGHATELDRVLGYEANYAGTSFATLDKWRGKDFKYGSDIVNIFADKTQQASLGAVGWDDEGVKTKKWDIIKDGILVNYQAIRDQAHIINEAESHGCCYSQSWNDVQFQRMANISLSPGKEAYSPDDMIKDVEKGIYIVGRGSYSIDQQRYNFQFGGTLFFEIENGKIKGPVNDVAYQSNTQEFWNSCTKICDESHYKTFGSFFDGKGQPSQISAVSHGSATTRFNGVNVINTARNI
jgi:TldD protein